MTIDSNIATRGPNAVVMIASAPLNSSSATPLAPRGTIYLDQHPTYGYRAFQYLRCDQAGGCTAGQLQSFIAVTAVNNITSGTTTSVTTAGLTADILEGGILYCLDDDGAAGAAPEGEKGRIINNTATVITIHPDDAFSVAPAANDDFQVILPWAVDDSADGDFAAQVAGVAMAAHDQYDYGWFQFSGIHPNVVAVAAGTTIPIDEGVVADTATVNDGAGDNNDLHVGVSKHQLSTDTVARTITVDLFCGAARKVHQSTA
jgi:hypothetical protein